MPVRLLKVYRRIRKSGSTEHASTTARVTKYTQNIAIEGRFQGGVLELLALRRGHFLLQSGHHGDLWLYRESLCARPRLVKPLAGELAERLMPLEIDIVCGPLIEGAFIALLVVSELGAGFAYSERFARPRRGRLFPAGYRVPDSLRESVHRKRVAIVNDMINAGSAECSTPESDSEAQANRTRTARSYQSARFSVFLACAERHQPDS